MVGEVLQTRIVPGLTSGDPFIRDTLATSIANIYMDWNKHRRKWLDERLELQNYLFATDTSTTSNARLPWKNKTTLPKLTQIRDNLHANYMAALFPNRNWLKWVGATREATSINTQKAITSYMQAKVEQSDFYQTMSNIVLDYIDYGNAIADVEWVSEVIPDPETGQDFRGYIGPRVLRISPVDIVFNPVAGSFKNSGKITRQLLNYGEFHQRALEGDMYDKERLDALMRVRTEAASKTSTTLRSTYYTPEDYDKSQKIEIDGFGTMYDYYRSGYVELLTFEGNIYDELSNKYYHNYELVVADRSYVMSFRPMPTWTKGGLKVHSSWRQRPDNLYGQGPLDNLVGMQYRIDHLENLKADVFDLIAFPPLKIRGSVEEFQWGPGCEIHLDADDSDVSMLVPDTTALQADTQIALLEAKMEEFAGAPKEALGIRTPGEKTAFEVQSLTNAASRLFQHKISRFEKDIVEPILNSMLEVTIRNMNTSDTVRVLNDETNIVTFLEVTREQLVAAGSLRPVGARHFAAKAQLVQNLSQLTGTNIWPTIQPHMSGKALAALVEESLDLERFNVFESNIAMMEQAESQQLGMTLQDQMMSNSMVEIDEEIPDGTEE